MSGSDADADHVHAHGAHHHHHHDGGGGEHDHDHPLERYDHVRGGSPALDIGGDIGALVATTDRAALGTELFVRSMADPSVTIHTGVWERDHAGSTVAAAVFVELRAGTYEVLDDSGTPIRDVVIDGGAVTTADLRAEADQNGVGIMSGSRSGSRYVPAS